MKKVIIIAVISFLAIAGAIYLDFSKKDTNTTEGIRTNDSGYEEGFDNGYDSGYEDGYNEAQDEYGGYEWLEYEGIHYARKYSEWSPEEAMEVIEAYQNKEPFWQDGSPPSHEEYLDAIESLYRFYEYFYCAMYN